MSLREVEDWGFDEEASVVASLYSAIEPEVEPRARPPATEPSRKLAYPVVLLVVALEILWLAFFGYWLLRLVM